MIPFLQLPKDTRKILFEQTAEKIGIPAPSVEKDWWVTIVLKAIFNGQFKSILLFKGGTSLSKCFNLINRFSEDIDLVLDKNHFGIVDNPSKSQIKN